MLKMKELKKVISELRFARKRVIKYRSMYKGLYYVVKENKYIYTFNFICIKIEKNIQHHDYFINEKLVNEKEVREELRRQFSIFGEEINNKEALIYQLNKLNINFNQREQEIVVNKNEFDEKINFINNIKNF